MALQEDGRVTTVHGTLKKETVWMRYITDLTGGDITSTLQNVITHGAQIGGDNDEATTAHTIFGTMAATALSRSGNVLTVGNAASTTGGRFKVEFYGY